MACSKLLLKQSPLIKNVGRASRIIINAGPKKPAVNFLSFLDRGLHPVTLPSISPINSCFTFINIKRSYSKQPGGDCDNHNIKDGNKSSHTEKLIGGETRNKNKYIIPKAPQVVKAAQAGRNQEEMPSLEIDSLYFSLFEDELKEKRRKAAGSKLHGSRQKSKIPFVLLSSAIPFIGFGFLDNFIMIVAGDYIDHMFGTVFCLSTMAAAALGNTLSDVAGIGSAYYVEKLVEMMGFATPKLTTAESQQPKYKKIIGLGRVLGIVTGCLIGMFPLLFMSEKYKADPYGTNITPETEKKSKYGLPKWIIEKFNKKETEE